MSQLLLGAAQLRELAARHGIRPTKRLGQNFVHDANTVRRVVRVAGVQPGERVLEVGPGLGSLTGALVESGAEVIAVEIDPVLAAVMHERDLPGVTVVEGDAVTLDPAALPGRSPTRLVANLPYNVAVPVLLRCLEVLPSLAGGVVMVQAEVADRLAAPPGSRTYGVPSLKAAWWAHMKPAGPVSRSVFWPAPNVDSSLVAFTRRPEPGDAALRVATFAVIDAAFAQRRKTLRAALAGWAGSALRATQILIAAGVDPGARGEQLELSAFVRIARSIR